ncbi:MAG: DEAD/DEAH box helicase, partial [Sphingobacterium sp.]
MKNKNIEKQTEVNITNFVMIPWMDNTPFQMNRPYILTLYKGDIDVTKSMLYGYFESFYSLDEFRLVGASPSERTQILIRPKPGGLGVGCDCGWGGPGICEHAAKVLYWNLPRDRNFFFKGLYDKNIHGLPKAFKDMLSARIDRDSDRVTLRLMAHKDHGLVFNLTSSEDEFPARWNYVRSWYRDFRLGVGEVEKVSYVVPLGSFIGGVPYVLPFASIPGSETTNMTSYLFDENPVDKFLEPADRYWEGLCRQMVALYEDKYPLGNDIVDLHADGDISQIKKQQMMLRFWRKMLRFPDKVLRVRLKYDYRPAYSPADARLKKGGWEVEGDLYLAGENLKVEAHLHEGKDFWQLKFLLLYKGAEVQAPQFYTENQSFFMQLPGGDMLFIDDVDLERMIHNMRVVNYLLTIRPQDLREFLVQVLTQVSGRHRVHVHALAKNSRVQRLAPTLPRVTVEIRQVEQSIVIMPEVHYEGFPKCNLAPDGGVLFRYQDDMVVYMERTSILEVQVDGLIRDYHESLNQQEHTGIWVIPLTQIMLTSWLNVLIETLEKQGIKVNLINIAAGSGILPKALRWELSDMKMTESLFCFSMTTNFADKSIAVSEFFNQGMDRAAVLESTEKECVYIRAEEKLLFRSLFMAAAFEHKYVVLTPVQYFAAQKLLKQIDPTLVSNDLLEQWPAFKQVEQTDPVNIPSTVTAALRSYQVEGVRWMRGMQAQGWGGILADDMGLGKTLQVITLLEHYYAHKPSAKPSLIVIPTSLIFNWLEEYNKFAARRRVVVYHGTDRAAITNFEPGTVVLTTYAMFLGEMSLLEKTPFAYLILDESQNVKNHKSKRYKGIVKITADHKIAMTGTPIENGVSDLYAQLSIVNPGLFKDYATFNRLYQKAALQGQPLHALQRIVEPFILRRTKKQVAIELPEKTETVLYMDMLPKQRKIYDKYRKIFKNEIQGNFESENSSRTKFIAIEALTKLRQLCASPALLKDVGLAEDAVKLDFVDEIITDVVPEHKVLIFSFFTSMLKLVRERLTSMNVPFSYLDGELNSSARARAVDQFQQDEGCRVFLISLKAGGTGLNLTAANYVYILDPWWNPAAEAQAIDRCYRIGQQKHVNAYKVVCRDSVEEKILALQN